MDGFSDRFFNLATEEGGSRYKEQDNWGGRDTGDQDLANQVGLLTTREKEKMGRAL